MPVAGLTDPCYAKELVATIDPRARHRAKGACRKSACLQSGCQRRSHGAENDRSLDDGPHTTHFSVVDAAGNAVASTTTLNDSYGSHVTSSAGFLLNDEMDDFTTQPGVPNALFGLIQSEGNTIGTGKAPVEFDDANDSGERWAVEFCDWFAGRADDYFGDAADVVELDAIWDGRAVCDQCATIPSPMAAGLHLDGKAVFAGDGGTDEGERLRSETARDTLAWSTPLGLMQKPGSDVALRSEG